MTQGKRLSFLIPKVTENYDSISVIRYRGEAKLVEMQKLKSNKTSSDGAVHSQTKQVILANLEGKRILSLTKRKISGTRFERSTSFNIYCYSNFFVVEALLHRTGLAKQPSENENIRASRVYDYNGKLINKHDHKWYDTNTIVDYFERQTQRSSDIQK